jgi:hypothetical protein
LHQWISKAAEYSNLIMQLSRLYEHFHPSVSVHGLALGGRGVKVFANRRNLIIMSDTQSQPERALIVGAGEGLSASLARLFHGEGMNVAMAARNPDKLTDL